MKAEERHELKDNDLMSWLQYGLPIWLKNNGAYVLLVLALGFLGWRLWSLYEQRQDEALQQAWADLQAANPRQAILMSMMDSKYEGNPASKLLEIADSATNKAVKAEATLELGDYYLLVVAFDYYPPASKLDRKDALTRAESAYNKALQEFGDDILVAGKATLGLAAVAEDRADWDVAGKYYETLADAHGKFAGTPFVELGQGKLAKLEDRRSAPNLASYALPRPAAPAPSPISPFSPSGSPELLTNPLQPGLIGPSSAPAITPSSPWQAPGMMGPPAPGTGGPGLRVSPPTGPAPSFTMPPSTAPSK